MATMGNCGVPTGGGWNALANSRLFHGGLNFTLSNWVLATNFSWRAALAPGSWNVSWRIAVYFYESDSTKETLIYLSSEQSNSGSGAGAFEMPCPLNILLSPGTYHFVLLICSYYSVGGMTINNASGGTSFNLSYKASNCSIPPSPIGSFESSGSQPAYWCLTYETVSETGLTVQAQPGQVAFDITGNSLYGILNPKTTSYSSSFPTGSTLTLTGPAVSDVHDLFEEIGPNSVAVASHSYAIRWLDKVFYANGYHWVFWTDTDSIMYYKNSPDGINWGTKTTVRGVNYKYGETAGVIYDGTYFHIHVKVSLHLELGIFRPESNGSLTMISPSWQLMHEAYCSGQPGPSPLTDHSYEFSPDGGAFNVWHYSKTGSISGIQMRYRNDPHDVTSDGLWSAGACVPSTIAAYDFRGNLILALPESKFLVLAVKTTETIKSYLWSGSWGSQSTVTGTGTVNQYPDGGENWAYSAVVDTTGNVHLVYLNNSYQVRYLKRDPSGSWSAERILFSGSRLDHDTRIVLDESTGDLYIFIAHAPSDNHIGLIKYCGSQNAWFSMIDLVNESATGLSTRTNSTDWGGLINADRLVRDERISLAYSINNSGGGHLIKFLYLKPIRSWQWRFKEWEDSSTNPVRTIILSGSTFTMTFEHWKEISELLVSRGKLQVWALFKVIKPRGNITFESNKFLSDILTLLGEPLKTVSRTLHQSISLFGIIPLKVMKFSEEILLLHDALSKIAGKYLEDLLVLTGLAYNSFFKHIFDQLILSEIIFHFFIPTIHTFARILLGRKKAYTLIQRLGAKIKRRGQRQENS